MDFIQLRNSFEALIRSGHIGEVQRQIEKINSNSVPRQVTADFADIARRVRSESWGLRLLRPIIRSEKPIHPEVTDHELTTYAGLLIKVGALAEAEAILKPLEPTQRTAVLIFLSQVYIAQWDYQKASVYLKKTLKKSDITFYQVAIAQINLAGAFIFLQKYTQAEKILKIVLKNCEDNKWDLLYGNGLELSAQVAVSRHQWQKASQFLIESEKAAGQHSHYLIFIEKWRTLSLLLQTEPESQQSQTVMNKIELIRQKAVTLNSWETVRDLDYHLASYLNHQNLLLNVYFGTPHEFYKRRIEKIFKNKGWKIPPFYFRKLSDTPTERILDLQSGAEDHPYFIEALKPGLMLHRFLNILALDFYKPIGVGELFSKLFPKEYFNPDSSKVRIAQAVKQLRKWFQTNQIPLDILVENNRYSLKARGPYAFKISKLIQTGQELLNSGFESQLNRLIKKWPYQSFSSSKAAAELKISTSAAQEILKKALKENRIFISGVGRSTLYRFQK